MAILCPNFGSREVRDNFNSLLDLMGLPKFTGNNGPTIHNNMDAYKKALDVHQMELFNSLYGYWNEYEGNIDEVRKECKKILLRTAKQRLFDKFKAKSFDDIPLKSLNPDIKQEFYYDVKDANNLKASYEQLPGVERVTVVKAHSGKREGYLLTVYRKPQEFAAIYQQSIKPGVPELFESNPELSNIGTQEQYSQYLDTIFPDSKVKDILYHGRQTKENIKNKIRNRNGFYFGTKDQAERITEIAEGSSIIYIQQAVLNLRNPKTTTFKDREVSDYEKSNDGFIIEVSDKDALDLMGSYPEQYSLQNFKKEYVAFEPEQIHILGSQQDIEGFKEFVNNRKSRKFAAIHQPIQQSRDEQFEDFLVKLITSMGIKIGVWNKIKQINGQDVEASYQSLKRLIGYIQGKEEHLPEEIAHAIIDILSDSNSAIKLLRNTLNEIEDISVLFDSKEEYEQYFAMYNGTASALIEEAIGKMLAKALRNQWNMQQAKNMNVNIWVKIKNALKQIVSKIKSIISKVNLSETERIYQKLYKTVDDLASDVINKKLEGYSLREIDEESDIELAAIMKSGNIPSSLIQGVKDNAAEAKRQQAVNVQLSQNEKARKVFIYKYKDKYKLLKRRIDYLEETDPDGVELINLKKKFDVLEKILEKELETITFEMLYDIGEDELLEIKAVFDYIDANGGILDKNELIEYKKTLDTLMTFPGLEGLAIELHGRFYPHIVDYAVSAVNNLITKGAYDPEKDIVYVSGEKAAENEESIDDEKFQQDIDLILTGMYHTGIQNQPVMQSIALLIRRARNNALRESGKDNEEIKEKIDKLHKFQKKHGVPPSKIYDDFIEEVKVRGIKTLRLVSPYTPEFVEMRNKMLKQRYSKDSKKAREASVWLYENVNMNNGSPKAKYKHFKVEGTGLSTAKAFTSEDENLKYYNTKYIKIQNTPELKEFYDYFQSKLREKRDTKLPLMYKASDYFIPNIHINTLMETIRYSNKPFFVALWRGILAKFSQEVVIDENSRYVQQDYELEQDTLGMKMMRSISSEKKSRDLGKALFKFCEFANLKHQVDNVMPMIRTLEYYMEGGYGKSKVYKAKGKLISWANTNMKTQMENDIKAKLMGEYKQPWGKLGTKVLDIEFDEETGEPTGKKVVRRIYLSDFVDFSIKWNSLLRIGYSLPNAINNMLYGQMMNVVMSAGGIAWEGKHFRKANSIFVREILKGKKGKLAKIVELFKPMQELEDYYRIQELDITKGKFAKGWSKFVEYGYSMQKWGEKYIQYTAAIASMLKQTERDKNGNKVSWWDMFDDAGNFKEDLMGRKFDEIIQDQISRYLQRTNEMIQGYYSAQNSATWSRYLLFRMFFQFKKWVPAWWEIKFAQARYDQDLGRWTEGRWRTLYRLWTSEETRRDREGNKISRRAAFFDMIKAAHILGKIKGGLEAGETIEGKLRSYKAEEIANIRATVRELQTILMTMIYYFATWIGAFGGGDDDKRKRWKGPAALLINQANKLGGDLTDLYKPRGWIQLIFSPAPVIKLYNDTLDFFGSVFNWMEYETGTSKNKKKIEYQTGKRKGKSKVADKFQKLVPLSNQYRMITGTYEEYWEPEGRNTY